MDPRVAAWTLPRSDVAAALEEVDRCRAMAPEQCLAEAAALSRCALAFLDRFPAAERSRLLRSQEPLDPRHEAVWRELVQRGRAR